MKIIDWDEIKDFIFAIPTVLLMFVITCFVAIILCALVYFIMKLFII